MAGQSMGTSLLNIFLLVLQAVLADYLVSPRVSSFVKYDELLQLCADGIPLLMEDHRPMPCQPPWLSEQRCPTGFWCHEGEDGANYYCCQNNRKSLNRCHLPPAVGFGKRKMRRFYYDPIIDGCHELYYTGIGGNENNFVSYEQCEQTCRGTGKPIVEEANLYKNMKLTQNLSSTPSTLHATSTMTYNTQQEVNELTIFSSGEGSTGESHTSRTMESSATPKSSSTVVTTVSPSRKNFTAGKETSFSTKVTAVKAFPTLVSVPGEFIPPFHGTAGLAIASTSSTDRPKMTSLEAESMRKPINFIFEYIMTSSEPPKVFRPTSSSSTLMQVTRELAIKNETLNSYGSFEKAQPAPTELSVLIPQGVSKSWEVTTHSMTFETFHQQTTAMPRLEEFAKDVRTANRSLATFAPKGNIPPPGQPRGKPSSSKVSLLPNSESRSITPLISQYTNAQPIISQILLVPQRQTTANVPKLHEKVATISTRPTVIHYSNPYPVFVPVSSDGSTSFENHNFTNSINPSLFLVAQNRSTLNPEPVEGGKHTYEQVMKQALFTKGASVPLETFLTKETEETKVTSKGPAKSGIGKETLESTGSKSAFYGHPVAQAFPYSRYGSSLSHSSIASFPIQQNPLCNKIESTMDNISVCLFPMYDDVVIMCALESVQCPAGTFCQIGDAQSICCPTPIGNKCEQPVRTGVGPSSLPRWYFDPTARECMPFLFRGFQGNENNFENFSQCQLTCNDKPEQFSLKERPLGGRRPTACDLPVISGHGNRFISRFFFSNDYGQCLHFIYSGEGGNLNNFANIHDCHQTCMRTENQYLYELSLSALLAANKPSSTFPTASEAVCPHGDVERNGTVPISCDMTTGIRCSAGFVCTSVNGMAFCCQTPESFCLHPRPPLSVCHTPFSPPVQRIEFTYDPLADRCVQFSYSSCSPSFNLNHFSSSSQCTRLCCNQGYNLVHKRRLMLANDKPLEQFDNQSGLQ